MKRSTNFTQALKQIICKKSIKARLSHLLRGYLTYKKKIHSPAADSQQHNRDLPSFQRLQPKRKRSKRTHVCSTGHQVKIQVFRLKKLFTKTNGIQNSTRGTTDVGTAVVGSVRRASTKEDGILERTRCWVVQVVSGRKVT